MNFLSIIGTRPEAVKMIPVLRALAREPFVRAKVCTTGQHREILDQVLRVFDLAPDFDLALMRAEQGISEIVVRTIERLDPILAHESPDRVIVQGDTSTAMAAALAAANRRIPVAHVEAGLRTYDASLPWPEECNRRVIALHADLHFAPTPGAKANLIGERLRGQAFVTGNSGIDALLHVRDRLSSDALFRARAWRSLPISAGRKLVLVTAHRRESFGAPVRDICAAVAALAARDDVEIIWPVHPNPAVREPVEALLGSLPRIRLLAPFELAPFVLAMQRAALILTDSGGVQEEAATLGKPVLVLRDTTERPEALAAGLARLVGTDPARIVAVAAELLDRGGGGEANETRLYGDGRAAERIVDGLLGRTVDEFVPAWPGQGSAAVAQPIDLRPLGGVTRAE